MINKEIIKKYYESSLDDDTILRAAIINRMGKGINILDAGAGSGHKFDISFIKDKANHIIGVDLENSICDNKLLDQRIIASLDDIPLPNEHVDLIFSRYVFEHLKKPEFVVSEFSRILKKDGYVIVLTVNKYHYVPIISQTTPHKFHEYVNKRRGRDELDTHPTYYNCNTGKALREIFENKGFKIEEVRLYEGVPNYLLWNKIIFTCGLLYERIVNSHDIFQNFRVTLLGVFIKA